MVKRIGKILAAMFVTTLVYTSVANSIQVYPRIFSPNGDGANDKVIFQIENPAMLPLQGEIFDMSGAKVGDLVPGPEMDTSLFWDGKRGGSPVPSGIYIYRVEVGGKSTTGTVVVVQ